MGSQSQIRFLVGVCCAMFIGLMAFPSGADMAFPSWWHVVKRTVKVDSIPVVKGVPHLEKKCVLVGADWRTRGSLLEFDSSFIVSPGQPVLCQTGSGSAGAARWTEIYYTTQEHLDSVGLDSLFSFEYKYGRPFLIYKGFWFLKSFSGEWADSSDKRSAIEECYSVVPNAITSDSLVNCSLKLRQKTTSYSDGRPDSVGIYPLASERGEGVASCQSSLKFLSNSGRNVGIMAGFTGMAKLHIADVRGRTILSAPVSFQKGVQKTVRLPEFASGIYFANISSGQVHISRKLPLMR